MARTFTDVWKMLDWQQISTKISNKTAADVEKALNSSQINGEDFMALISPVARAYIEPLAQRAQQLTRQRFGNVVSFYLPLYLSNVCSNDCTYCGFSMSNKIKRKILNFDEITQECDAIKKLGYNSLLLVTGEHQTKVGMDYFRQVFSLVRERFSTVMMEVQPLSENEYAELKQFGLDGVMVYQESYHLPTYDKHHLRGQKKDFVWRLETHDRLGSAKIDKIGLGVLNGLSDDWRADCYMLAEHLTYLQNTYWQSRYSISFPRLRPCAGGITPASLMDETELLQLICAFRLLSPDVELSLSTRESAYFRDHAVPIAINQVSAYSKTQPGGYANNESRLEQFSPDDNRTPQEVASALQKAGLQPIWKDWDSYLGRM